MPDLTLLTVTADQPVGFALCEHYMQRQDLSLIHQLEWVVVDDGVEPIRPTLGQRYFRRKREDGCTPVESMCLNLLTGLAMVKSPLLAIIEHDDFYDVQHLTELMTGLKTAPLAGVRHWRFYNVEHRYWLTLRNADVAALCQTGMRRSMYSTFANVVHDCMTTGNKNVDGELWKAAPHSNAYLSSAVTGIKGLPGRRGIGMGHDRPSSICTSDPHLKKLREWIGGYADVYADVMS